MAILRRLGGCLGCLGEILFQVSDQTVRTLKEWKWSGSARYATHSRHGGNALTEFTGLEPDRITFQMMLLRDLGVDPMTEISRLWKYEREGIAVPLTVGSHAYGRYRWNVLSHETSIDYTDVFGDILVAEVSVTLQEYLKE